MLQSFFVWLAAHWQDVIAVALLAYIVRSLNQNTLCIAVMKQQITSIDKAVNNAAQGERTLREYVKDNNEKISRLEGRLEKQ